VKPYDKVNKYVKDEKTEFFMKFTDILSKLNENTTMSDTKLAEYNWLVDSTNVNQSSHLSEQTLTIEITNTDENEEEVDENMYDIGSFVDPQNFM
jgi:hypothetical protein